MTMILLMVHLFCCVLCLCLKLLRRLRVNWAVLFLAVLVPVFGLCCLMTCVLWSQGQEEQTAWKEPEDWDWEDEIYHSIPAAPDRDAARMVPVEESLLLNSPVKRRQLLLILSRNPAEYVPQLRMAGQNDDTEVVHYAVTALVELRKEFFNGLSEMEQKLKRSPEDRETLRAYVELEERYLKSGLPEGAERRTCLEYHCTLLEKLRTQLDPTEEREQISALLERQADAAMELRSYQQAEELIEQMIQLSPEQERGYLLRMKCCAAQRDRNGIDAVLSLLRAGGVPLSPAGESAVRFWSGQPS